MTITGKTLIKWGFAAGQDFKEMIATAQTMEAEGIDENTIYDTLLADKTAAEAKALAKQEAQTASLGGPMHMRTNSIPFKVFLEPESGNVDEERNLAAVIGHMDHIMRLPTVVDAAVMPDAMPSGSEPGTIPVGGVVVTEDAIHPGMHSADVCCSMAITVFKRDEDVSRVLDEAMKVTHFGYGKRTLSEVRRDHNLKDILSEMEDNLFLKDLTSQAEVHFMTQGDGNHFLYVGHLESTGQLALVTHHGSRSLGATLYKYGMAAAQKHTGIVSPRTPVHQAWLKFDTEQGQEYWGALQIVRSWTKMNHFGIHDAIARRLGNKVDDRFWNEHNFVFRKDDRFYHAKGATPSYDGFSPDDDGRTLIPMNMSQPILITEHANQPDTLYFAPHGAGRNFSRTDHERRIAAEFGEKLHFLSDETKRTVLERETAGLDVRFFAGPADLSELPSSYKSAAQVEASIRKHNLARIVDRIMPGGSIMAGNVPKPWLEKKKGRT